jgi:hypothetical protein
LQQHITAYLNTQQLLLKTRQKPQASTLLLHIATNI